jgi:hypothetical protein
VVDFLLEVAHDFLPGVILEELGWLDGVTAEGISTYPRGWRTALRPTGG